MGFTSFLAEGIIFMGYEAKPKCPLEDKVVCSLTILIIPTQSFPIPKYACAQRVFRFLELCVPQIIPHIVVVLLPCDYIKPFPTLSSAKREGTERPTKPSAPFCFPLSIYLSFRLSSVLRKVGVLQCILQGSKNLP